MRAGRQGDRPHAQAALCRARGGGASRRRGGAPSRRASRRSGPAARATIRSTPRSCRAAGSTRTGSEKETWHIEFDLAGTELDYEVGDSFGIFPANDPALVDAVHRRARRAAGFPDRRPHAARGADRRRVAVAGARHAVPAHLLHHRRRAQGRRPRRSADGEDPDGDAATLDVLAALQKFPGIRPDPEAFIEALDPLQPRVYSISSSLKTSTRPRLAHRRCRALRGRQAHAPRRRLDLPRRPRQARRQAQGLCAEGAAFRAAGRSGEADHHDRPRHRHRAVPRLPARAAGDQGARAATGCSSATSAAITTSSTRRS